MEKSRLRIGIGYDSHPLVPGDKLVLGGISIPYDKRLSGWSDADVLVHAIIDALCGAANLGDKGTLFPAGEPESKDVSSLILLDKICKLLNAKGLQVINIDTTIIAHEPKLSPFIHKMRELISQTLNIDIAQITIKASTSNGLGFVGRKEGIAAQAITLIQETPFL
jgi:2-C-methyl-D-erythritol 2,4-cyclodiphosphate synthase